MGFKSAAVSIGTSDTDIFEMGAGLEGAVIITVGNTTGGAIAYALKFYKQSLGTTTTLVSGKSFPANDFQKVQHPFAMEAGDKIIMSGASAGLRAAGTITDSAEVSSGGSWNPRGDYSAVATYAKRDVVYVPDDGVSYISLQDSNTGNTPSTQPSFWMVNAAKGDPGADGELTQSEADALYSPIVLSTRTITGTTDTLVLTDNGKRIYTSNGSAVTITVPPNASVAFEVDAQIDFIQEGTGKVTFAEGSGVTIRSAGGYLSIAAQYGGATLVYRGSDNWDLEGLLSS